MTDGVYWIWFQLVFGIGTRRAELFLEYFKDPSQIMGEIAAGGRAVGMMEEKELQISPHAMERAAEIRRRTLKKGCEIIPRDHPDYPALLTGIYSPPAVLYAKGELSCLKGALAIAMVGSRSYTEYGKQAASLLAGGLAGSGAVVVSGLAPGIDTESHWAALAGGGKTVGVLGCGIDVDYPKASRELKTAVSQSGAVVTEYPLGTQPRPEHFPMRNRIISGMSDGTLVVEAGRRSGSLITARYALEQGRELFAVPGSIFAGGEQGTHRLIKDGAFLVDGVEDILSRYPAWEQRRKPAPRLSKALSLRSPPLGADTSAVKRAKAADSPGAPPAQKKKLPEGVGECAALVYDCFGQETLTVDELASLTALEAAEILVSLTELEIYGLVQSYPGRRFGLL